MNPLNAGHMVKNPRASVVRCAQQQPRNRISGWRIHLRYNFSSHFAAVFVPPSRSEEVLADLVSVRVKQRCFRRFQAPFGLLVGAQLADVSFSGTLGTEGFCPRAVEARMPNRTMVMHALLILQNSVRTH